MLLLEETSIRNAVIEKTDVVLYFDNKKFVNAKYEEI